MSGLAREVPPLSKAVINSTATLVRDQWTRFSGNDPDAFPVADYLEKILQRMFPEFVLDIREDSEMGGMEGATWPDQMHMQLPRTTYDEAINGEGRARFTIAHELGHLVLHRGIPFARMVPQNVQIAAYRNSEWQANEYAGALLMPAHKVEEMATIREVAVRCGVSFPAAQTRIAKLNMKKPQG